MKKYLKIADVFVGEYKPKRRIDAWPPSRYGETLVELSGSPAQYAAHAINSHDELVTMNKELLAALEANEKFWTIRGAELGELSPEAKAVRDAGLAAIAKAKWEAAS